MSTSVIVVSYTAHEWLRPCVESVVDQADEVIVVDNGSPGSAASATAESIGVRSLRLDRNVGLPAGINAGLAEARGDVVALLNDDAIATPGWLSSAVVALADEDVGAVAPKLVFAFPFAVVAYDDEPRHIGGDRRSLGRAVRSITLDGRDLLGAAIGPGLHRIEHGEMDGREGPWRWTTGRETFLVPLGPDGDASALRIDGEPPPILDTATVINSAGTYLSAHGFGGDYGFGSVDDGTFDSPAERFGGCGAALAMRSETLARIGTFAAGFFAYYEDLDWCWRARLAGLRVRYEPSGVVRHVGGATSGGPEAAVVRDLAARNRLLCLARNAPLDRLIPEIRRARSDDPAPGFDRRLVGTLPAALRQRATLRRVWQRRPRDIWNEWAGADERWAASAPG